jgi:Flp pilus assembly pilin Flp
MLKSLTALRAALARAFDEERAQALTEYALILALIAVVALAGLHLLGNGIKSELTTVATSL